MLEAMVLAVVQGITEFLPVSSDGHLILIPSLLGWKRFGLGFDVLLHAGTLLATLVYFRRDVGGLLYAFFSRSPSHAAARRLAWLILGATVLSGVLALAMEPLVEQVEFLPMPDQTAIAGGFLLLTAVTLGLAEILGRRNPTPGGMASLTWKTALLIAVAQALAVAPGLSRSGMTIAAGLALGLRREESARFSFLLSMPIIAAAVAKKSLDLWQDGGGALPPAGETALAVLLTTATGLLAIVFIMPFVKKHSLWWFSGYCVLAGAGALSAGLGWW